MKKLHRVIFIVFVSAWLLAMMIPLIVGFKSTVSKGDVTGGKIVNIDSTSFFNYMPGVIYTYFGSPTSPECAEFEPILEKELESSNWTVYYFDTNFWKGDAQYERIVDKYKVISVPSLVRTINGKFDSSYQYTLEGEAAALIELDRFFIPKYSGLSDVTSKEPSQYSGYPGFPIQFHNRLTAITFLGMLINAAYLFSKLIRKSDVPGIVLLITAINSSVLMALHFLITRLGFSFTLQYNADPDQTILGIIGKSTWLLETPVLYIGILVLCVYFAISRKIKESTDGN